jgi:hypothetical protein
VPLGELVPVSVVFFLSFSLKMVQFQHFQTGLCCGAQPLSSTFLFVYVEVDGVPKKEPTLKRIAFFDVRFPIDNIKIKELKLNRKKNCTKT